MRIALFGGSFDPPHRGHLSVAQAVVDHHIVDAVWFVPCANHPFAKTLSPAHHRLTMLRLLSDDHYVYQYEIAKPTPSYSLETLLQATREFPSHDFVWLMGSDLLGSFTRWYHYQELLQQFTVLVYPRAGHDLSPLLPGMTALTSLPAVALSSTSIRAQVQNGQSITPSVPPAVANYIQSQQLYRL